MALDPNRWTLKTQEAFNAATEAARSRNHAEVTPDHFLLAMLGQEGTVVLPILAKVGVAALPLRNRVEEALGKLPRSYSGSGGASEVQLNRDLRTILNQADTERGGLGDEYLSIEHILLAMASRLKVSRDDLLTALKEVRGSHRVSSQNPEEQYQALE
ncbi:MAG: Clp protease N-terminal domain-containing protein, partial [Acidimicrobiales bacterium]